jgi:ceramide glucosyltransferase
VSLLFLALVIGSLTFSALSVAGAFKYLAVRPPAEVRALPISLLKPLSGLDEGLEENLRTFFEQDYVEFEILFAVRDAADPAAAVVNRLCAEYPNVRARLLLAGEPAYANAKVYSLSQMIQVAAHDLIVMSDSDTRVTPKFLRVVAAEFQDPKVGVATCPYRAVPGRSLWSKLEATGLNTDFMAGILVARMLEGMRFAVGPTIVARRQVIEMIGGFDRLKDYLAEDFVLGKFAADAGQGVILSSYVIEHHIGTSDLRQNLAHRLRWVRSTRRSRPAGYMGQVFTMPLPLVLLLWLTAWYWWPVVLLALAIRILSAYVVATRVLRARLNWLLVPMEDMVAFGFWIAGFFGNTIIWRGTAYRLKRDGRFELAR